MVPRHELLSKEDSERLLKELGIKSWQLPRIAQDDPAIRGMNPEVGQLVKITRRSQLTGEYVVYRAVSAAVGLKAPAEPAEKKKEKPVQKVEKKAKAASTADKKKSSRAKSLRKQVGSKKR